MIVIDGDIMRVTNSTVYTPGFGRAFTTDEKQHYKQLIKDSQKALRLRDTTAIVFDFNVPSEKGYNIGIGSTFSDSMLNFTDFMQTMIGISSVQLEPQGQISPSNTSPYSGTNFALGEHIIDLKKLTRFEYAQILSDEDIQEVSNKYPGNKEKLEYKTDYNYVIGSETRFGNQEKLLKKAYRNFGFGMSIYDLDTAKLDYDFQQFKEKNNFWLEPETLFKILTEEYGTDNFEEWRDEDKNLYSETIPESIRKNRIDELNSDYKELLEYEKFKQFLADKQQNESKKEINSRNIKLYGDCLLGFAKSEIWANKDCFKENLFYGGPDENCPETNDIQIWGLNALDYSKLGEIGKDGDTSKLGAAGKLLYRKYEKFFQRYDGLRMDAAWQFVTPFLYTETEDDFEKVDVPDVNNRILDILSRAAKNVMGRNFDISNPSSVMLELVGTYADKSKELTKNTYPHLFSTSYAEYNETPEKFKKIGYHQNKFYIGIGNHDNDSLVNLALDEDKKTKHIEGLKEDFNIDMSKLGYKTEEYTNQSAEDKALEDFRNAKFAEIFTTAKQFFTMPDMFGMAQRINISGKESPDNWRVRIPSNYEEFYFSQLSNGYGLNVPKAYENALYMKHIDNPQLTKKLAEAAEILRQKGPNTEQAANEAMKNGELKNKFIYKA